MFIIDDVLLRALGLSLPGLDLIWLFEQIRDFTFKEMRDQIKDMIKENRMLYELGDISKNEYEATNMRLNQKLRIADRADDMNLYARMNILGG
jgi:hypothetical protein